METSEMSTKSEVIAAIADRWSQSARRPGQSLACGWFGSPILLPARGRTPKWCSSYVAIGPENSPAPPRQDSPPSRSSTGSSRSIGSLPSLRKYPSPPSPAAGRGLRR